MTTPYRWLVRWEKFKLSLSEWWVVHIARHRLNNKDETS